MAGWTATTILNKLRLVSGRVDASQLSNELMMDYINNYYQYVMPKELKIFYGFTYYSFVTQPYLATYTPPSGYQNFGPALYVDGFPSTWYLDPALFYQDYPQQDNKYVIGTGDGTALSFSYTAAYLPILPGTVYVTDGSQTLYDTQSTVTPSTGTFGPASVGSGAINYLTGVMAPTFVTAPAANTTITLTYQSYTANRPQGLLYYNNTFTLRPVPDNVYQVRMQGIQIPTPLALAPVAGVSVAVPFRPDLGPLIAYGAALEIFSDYNQDEEYASTMVLYMRYKDVCMQDTYEEYMTQRAISTF